MAKTTPYPPSDAVAFFESRSLGGGSGEGVPCTVTLRCAQGFWLKYQDSARCCRRVTLTKTYRRAFSIQAWLRQHGGQISYKVTFP